MNIRKVHNDRFDSRKVALIGLNTSVKVSIIPDDETTGLRNLVRDYYYFKDQQSAIALKLSAKLRVSFPQYLKVFSSITAKTSLMLLAEYPLASDILAADKDTVIEAVRACARFGQGRAEKKYNAIVAAARDAAVFGRALPSSAIRIRLYVSVFQEYQAHLDSILKELHKAVDNLENAQTRNRICLLQTLQGAGFLSAAVLVAEMGSFDLFSSPKKLYAYFGLDPAVKQSGKFTGDQQHMSKRGPSLAKRILHMAALNNLKVGSITKEPVNPVVYNYYKEKCKCKKKKVAIGAVMHKICNIIYAMLRDNQPFRMVTPQEHCEQYACRSKQKTAA